MSRSIFITLALVGLVACGETSAPAPSNETLELSEVAVEDSDVLGPVGELLDAEPESTLRNDPDFLASVPEPVVDSGNAVLPGEGLDTELAEAPEPVPTRIFELRHGENLHIFAKWSEVPVEDIAELSGLDLAGDYPVGTEVALPVEGVDIVAVESAREAHWLARIDGYLESRGGETGTDFYTVKTGDTAWGIARESHGIPIWLLAAYNPSISLDSLHPGDKLMVPVTADIVVDAAPADTAE